MNDEFSPNVLADRVQGQLESLYGFGLAERVEDFIINQQEAKLFIKNNGHYGKMPKELFLVRKPEMDEVEVALYLDRKLLTNLKKNNPFLSLNEKNLSDFCILIEGVSHFVYFLWKAQRERPITQLEMELQAEIDKFLMLFFFLRSDKNPEFPHQLFDALFEDFKLVEQLSSESRGRYLTASSLASKYCHALKEKFAAQSARPDLLEEIRAFYNLSQEQKIRHIVH